MSAERVDLQRIEVGEPRADEIEPAIDVASRALADGPLTVAVIGDDLDLNFRYLRRFFRLQYRLAPHQRPLVARLDGRVVASTNDLHDGACHAGPLMKLRSLPALLATRPTVAVRAARWFADWERRDPGGRPHSHFGPFGVEPELQGRGIGSLVLTEYCRRLDASGEDSYLETEKPENVALYSRFGFEVIEEAEVLGVPNWFMWRDAGALAPGMRSR
ncbi:MAG: GNAT family N-acetyltransferase [Solirubrobacterales bacterium]